MSISPIPEPASYVLMLVGLAVVDSMARWQKGAENNRPLKPTTS
ncbi:MAG: PEP-CTERM sorting domain-containing protein [Nitrosospira sp.]